MAAEVSSPESKVELFEMAAVFLRMAERLSTDASALDAECA
jgi:hypothetical protein